MAKFQEQPQDARAIANYILDEASKYGIDDLSPLKLQKLIFLAHGWSYYLRGAERPLVKPQPLTWQYGPVYPEVYKAVRKYGGAPIRERIMNEDTNFPYEAQLTDEQKKGIDAVLSRYGQWSGFRLSNLTHLRGSPWSETMEAKGSNAEISAKLMKNYYCKMAREMGLPE